MSNLSVLLIDSDTADAAALCETLERDSSGIRVRSVPDLQTARERLASSSPDVILSEAQLPDGTVFELLSSGGSVPIVVRTDSGSMRLAVQAIRAGAADVVCKCEKPGEVVRCSGWQVGQCVPSLKQLPM